MITINITDALAVELLHQLQTKMFAARTVEQKALVFDTAAKPPITRSRDTRPKIMAVLAGITHGEKFTTQSVHETTQIEYKKVEAMLANLITVGLVQRLTTGVYKNIKQGE